MMLQQHKSHAHKQKQHRNMAGGNEDNFCIKVVDCSLSFTSVIIAVICLCRKMKVRDKENCY